MATRTHRDRKQSEDQPISPPPLPHLTPSQRYLFIASIVALAGWFLYLVYVAFFA